MVNKINDVRHTIVCQERSIRFQIEVQSLSSKAIVDALVDCPDINKILNRVLSPRYNPLGQKAMGFFPDPYAVGDEMYSNAKKMIKDKYGSIKINCISLRNDQIFKSKKEMLSFYLLRLLDLRYSSYMLAVDTGEMILHLLKNFLKRGHWFYQMRLVEESKIGMFLNDKGNEESLKKYLKESHATKLINTPTIWFGLEGEPSIDCWTLTTDSKLFKRVDVCYREGKMEHVEAWKLFWFNSFWILDWNTILNNKGESLTTWMFAEYNMIEPAREFEHVRNSCPIMLNKYISSETLLESLSRFFFLNANLGYPLGTWDQIHVATKNYNRHKSFFKKLIIQKVEDDGYCFAKNGINDMVQYIFRESPTNFKNRKERIDYIYVNLPDQDQLGEYIWGEWRVGNCDLIGDLLDWNELHCALYHGAGIFLKEYFKCHPEL